MNKIFLTIGAVVVLVVILILVFKDNSKINMEHDDDVVAEYEIYPGDVADKIERGEDFILLDVRTPEEYAELHLENALLLPVQDISQSALANIGLGEDAKNKEIVIYCRSGGRSKQAYDIMSSLGYTNITSVAGGMIHWQEDSYPFTESGYYDGIDYKQTISPEIVDGAKISFDKDTHDFGTIEKLGGTVETDFVITNTGTENLIIGDITTSCSCTSAIMSSKDISPNEKAILSVTFDPNFHEEPAGEFTRTVFIPTNDPSIPEAEVSVSVEII